MKKFTYLLLPGLVCLLLASFSALAAADAFTLDWWTVEGGGSSQGGDFQLRALVGQPDAGATMYGGDFSLAGGFLPAPPGEAPPHIPLFLPLVVR